MDKASLRNILMLRLNSLSRDEVLSLSFQLTNQLITFFSFHSELLGQVGGAFLPMNAEIAPSYQELLKTVPVTLAYPVLNQKTMSFGIPQGQPRGAIWLEPPFLSIDPGWLLVPGVGFDFAGARMGRGKGYYDRYLEGKKVLKIGIAWSEQIVEKIPMESHDCSMDFIITESFCWDVAHQRKF